MQEKEIPLMQLIDKDGNFNNSGLDSLVKTVGLARCGISYAMVSIMGPQSSGKSTLLNHLFHTSFQEMDAYKRRGQTTQGVWLAKAGVIDPCTLVMDLEGTDGRERGEDDTTFEKQSSLFALAISDIVLVNMWCHDIGREHAANKPLLKTVFQVMMRLFTPRKTTLLFVIRDKTKTPMEVLEPILREDLQKIWNSVPKPSTLQESTLDEFFKVEVTALSSYEAKEEQFKKEVSLLQRRFMNSTSPGGIAGDRRAVVPGAGLALSMQEIWRIIKENKDLDLPAHKVMVATVRCEEIANQKLLSLSSHKDWQDLNERSKTGPVPNLGKSLSHLIEDHICGYDAEAGYFESSVRDTKRKYFMDRALEIIQPAHQAVVGHYRMAALNKFKEGLERASMDEEFNNRFASAVQHIAEECIADFDRGCADAHVDHSSWDLSKLQQKLCRDIETHAESVQNERITCIMNDLKEHLAEALSAPVDLLLSSAATNTWSSIRKLLEKETERAREALLVSMTGFNIDATAQNKLLDEVENFATSTVVKRAREEAAQALVLMKERFNAVFTHDVDSMPRVWSAEDNIREITKDARLAALKLLSVLAAIRLRNDVTDTVLDTLRSSLGGEDVPSTTSASSTTAPLGSTWSDVDPADTLITPVKCKQLWKQFKIETEYTISQALAAQEAIKRGNSWLPPPWAIVAMVVLGFNELMAVIRHPIYMALFFILYLIGKALWVQLDLGQDFQYGLLPGLLSIWTKVLPIGMRILKKLAEEGQQLTSDHGSGVTASNYTTSYQNGTRPPLQKKVQDDVDRVQFTSGNGMATKSFSHR